MEGFRTWRSSTPYQSRFKIIFRFQCDPIDFDWACYQDSSSELIRQYRRPTIRAEVVLALQQFLHIDQARQIISENLNDWPLPAYDRMWLIDDALVRARERVRDTPLHHDAVYLDGVPQTVYLHHYFDMAHLIDQGESRMVPASEWAIQSLEKKTLANNKDESCCTICMEDFFDGHGCEALLMPCSHAFHGECIKKWLRTSHYCPVCRFEMPTSPD